MSGPEMGSNPSSGFSPPPASYPNSGQGDSTGSLPRNDDSISFLAQAFDPAQCLAYKSLKNTPPLAEKASNGIVPHDTEGTFCKATGMRMGESSGRDPPLFPALQGAVSEETAVVSCPQVSKQSLSLPSEGVHRRGNLGVGSPVLPNGNGNAGPQNGGNPRSEGDASARGSLADNSLHPPSFQVKEAMAQPLMNVMANESRDGGVAKKATEDRGEGLEESGEEGGETGDDGEGGSTPGWDDIALGALQDDDSGKFVWALEGFFRERGEELVVPKFYGTPVDVAKLFRIVQNFGGYGICVQQKLWKRVGSQFKPPESCTTVSTQFRKSYEQALLAFERHVAQSHDSPAELNANPDMLPAPPLAARTTPSGGSGFGKIDLTDVDRAAMSGLRKPTARLAAKRAAREAAEAAAAAGQLFGSGRTFGGGGAGQHSTLPQNGKVSKSASLAAAYAATRGGGSNVVSEEGDGHGRNHLGWMNGDGENGGSSDFGAMLPSMQDGEVLTKMRQIDALDSDGEGKLVQSAHLLRLQGSRKKGGILGSNRKKPAILQRRPIGSNGHRLNGNSPCGEEGNSGEEHKDMGMEERKRRREDGDEVRSKGRRKPHEPASTNGNSHEDIGALFSGGSIGWGTGKMLRGSLLVTDEGPPADWVLVNVRRQVNCFEIFALVPGLLRDEVRVQCEASGRLIIVGDPGQAENPWGVTPFRKVVQLPGRIDTSQTSATVTLHGQLYVKAPALD